MAVVAGHDDESGAMRADSVGERPAALSARKRQIEDHGIEPLCCQGVPHAASIRDGAHPIAGLGQEFSQHVGDIFLVFDDEKAGGIGTM